MKTIFLKKKFIDLFQSKLKEIQKKYKDYKMIVCLDCPRKDIWRNTIYKDYKQTRVSDDSTGNFFKLVRDLDLFAESGIQTKISHPYLEADDCIAVITNHLFKKDKNNKVVIITSDHDYLQLFNQENKENLFIVDARLKPLSKTECYKQDRNKELFIKIISGDKSDNILPLFKRCGKKTLESLYINKELFEKKLNQEKKTDHFNLNKMLIDFDYIPSLYKNQLLSNFV